METFQDYAQQYLEESEYEKALSTFRSERSKVNNLLKTFGKLPIKQIPQSAVRGWKIKAHKRFKNKTINEHFTILRSIFATALGDGVIAHSPMDGIENLKIHSAEPLPFEREELIKLQSTDTDCASGKALALLGILTGLRISELIALTWDCIDFELAELQVNKAKVLGEYKVPKTSESIRTVELNQHALALLKAHFEVTGKTRIRVINVLQHDNKSLDKQRVRHVFINTSTNKPFIDAKQYGKTFFTPFLTLAKVKHRGPNQLRHTFASQCLTAGISIVWIANQMGHASTKMVEEHYARWIKKDAPDHSGSFSKSLNDVFNKFGKLTPGATVASHGSSIASWVIDAQPRKKSESVRRCVQSQKNSSFSSSRCAGRVNA